MVFSVCLPDWAPIGGIFKISDQYKSRRVEIYDTDNFNFSKSPKSVPSGANLVQIGSNSDLPVVPPPTYTSRTSEQTIDDVTYFP